MGSFSPRRLVAAGLLLASLFCTAADLPPRPIVVYDDSWNEFPAEGAAATSLAALPSYLNVVDLAFARPDLIYSGDLDLRRTGLEYSYSGAILRDSIDLLKARNPGTRVLLSVGGSAYHNWRGLDASAVARLVRDLHADGVDMDYEPQRPSCLPDARGSIHCQTDARWPVLIGALRAALPRPQLLTLSVWSVGAYGETGFRNARPRSAYTGFMLSLLHSPVAAQIDLISINAYDAGPSFDPLQAFRAYRALWHGPLALGLAVHRKGGDGPFYNVAQAEALARSVASDREGGMMLYPLLAMPDGPDSAGYPDGRGLAMAFCRGLGMAECGVSPP